MTSVHQKLFQLCLGRRIPIVSDTLQAPGIAQPVTIRRDRHGVPYIEAATDSDAWYGLGFCQGQDRAFQLEMLLRLAQGTLSALIGPGGLAIDRLSRRIGFWRLAQQQVGALDPATRQMFAAFARGVTEGARIGCKRPAHEFALLGAKPTPYRAVDVLANLKFIAFRVSFWSAKLTRWIVLREDGQEALTALGNADAVRMPVEVLVGALGEADALRRPVVVPVEAPAGAAIARLAQDAIHLSQALGEGGASNSWALDSSRTATKRPLLANDPHLAPTLPPPWKGRH